MIPSDTQANIDIVLAALAYRQSQGLGPLRGEINAEWMEYFSREIEVPVSASTWRRLERIALRKASLAQAALDALHLLRPAQP